jgi:hypothetical protein
MSRPVLSCHAAPVGERIPMKKLLLMFGALVVLAVTAEPLTAQSPFRSSSSGSKIRKAFSKPRFTGNSGHAVVGYEEEADVYGRAEVGYPQPGFAAVGYPFPGQAAVGYPGMGAGFRGPHGPHAMGGQLVFPQHPFVRSPRDFFMMD